MSFSFSVREVAGAVNLSQVDRIILILMEGVGLPADPLEVEGRGGGGEVQPGVGDLGQGRAEVGQNLCRSETLLGVS